MTDLLAWFNPTRWILLAAFAAAVVLGVPLLVHRYDEGQQEIGAARERAKWMERDRQVAEANAKETARRLKAQEDSNRESKKFIDQAADAAVADRGSRERMHSDLAAATAARRSADPGSVAQCASAEAAADLYLDLFGRADARASELAAYADQARIAGQQCERDFDSLTPATSP